MPKAVRYHQFGGTEVLQIEDVPRPEPGPDEVLVRVKAAGINPGEASIRRGLMAAQWPSTFPSGQGSDLAGVVEGVGNGVTAWKAGDEVIGFTDKRASQAEYVVVPQDQLTARPPAVPWEVAGALFVAGTTAYATVQSVNLQAGETVVVSGASGGVGTLVVQLAKRRGATVIGIASESRADWLREHGVVPVAYGNDLPTRLQAAAQGHLDAWIDTAGQGYVKQAVDLGVSPERIDTIIDFAAVKEYGVKSEGSAAAARADVLAELAGLIASGELEVPVARTYPLDQVRDAYTELEQHHTLGKIVLIP